MATTLEDIIEVYYDLQGDDPPATPEDQDIRLANATCRELTRRRNFSFAKAEQTATIVSLQASLVSNFRDIYDVRYKNSGCGDDIVFDKTDSASLDSCSSPSYCVTGDEESGWKIAVNTSDYSPLNITFYRRHSPLASMSDTTFFPDPEPIALGMWYRKYKLDNQGADATQEKNAFEEAFASMVIYDQRLNGRRGRHIGIHEAKGYRTGE